MDFLLMLPPEIISIILRKLSTIDLVNFALANQECEHIIESDPVLIRRVMTFHNASFIKSMPFQKRNMELETTLRNTGTIQDYLRWFQNNRSCILEWPKPYKYYRRNKPETVFNRTSVAHYPKIANFGLLPTVLKYKRKRDCADGYEADDECDYIQPRKRFRNMLIENRLSDDESMETIHE